MSLATHIASTLGHGKELKSGDGWSTLCPIHGDDNPSLSVRDITNNKGEPDVILKCFAGCGFKEIKSHLRGIGLLPEWKPKKTSEPKKEKDSFVWQKSRRDDEKVKKYFAKRAIIFDDDSFPVPPSLKWNSYIDKKAGDLVELVVAAATTPTDKSVKAVQRLFIDIEDYSKTGAKMLGKMQGRGVYFYRKRPMTELMIGEGIETTLSVMQVTGMNGVAALSASGLKNIKLPPETETIYILVDSDKSFAGQKASCELAGKFEKKGGQAFIVSPDDSCFTGSPKKRDFNDLLQEVSTGGLITERMAAAIPFKELGWKPPSDTKTPGDVIHKLSDLLAEGKIAASQWFPVLHDAGLDPPGEDEVLQYLASQKVGTKRSLNKEYKARSEESAIKNKWHGLAETAGDRKLVEYLPHDLNRVTLLTEEAIIAIPGQWPYFNYGGMLSYSTYEHPARKAVGIDNVQPPMVPVIRPYSRDNLHLRAEQSVLHYKVKETETSIIPYPVATPQPIINKLIDHPSPLAPRVSGLVSHPVISLEGRVISSEGIDKETGLLLQFGGSSFRVPKNTTRDDAKRVAGKLTEKLFAEFCFRDEPSQENLYQTAALAFLLSGIFRKVIDQAPGFLIVANVQGSGKTTLARIVHVILTGRDMPVSSLGGNPEEMKKEMLATLMQSPAMVCYDNLLDGSEIRDPILAKVITSPHFKGRVLGKSQEITVPTNSVLALTGNNVSLSADLVRRFLTIHLTTDVARPETRTFRHPDIVQHCLNLRVEAVQACLAITAAYIEAGCPLKPEELRSSGFNQWDRTVRFPLLWATGVDILESMNLNRQHSTEHLAMLGLMRCLDEIFENAPFSATELLNQITNEYNDSMRETRDHLRECIANMSPKALKSTRSLSWVLKKLIGRQIEDMELKYQANSSGNYGKYFVDKPPF